MTATSLPASKSEAALTAVAPLLSVKEARIGYGESVVVDGVSLEVAPGEIVCLLGRNGAGKTTLMRAIMGTLNLRGGSVSLSGKDMRRWPPYKRARAHIGYVPQGRGIFPYLSVLENILIGLEPVKGQDTGQVEEVLDVFPILRSMAGRPAGLLSGGQQQQLAIARALVGRPDLLLLDEPTEGIQPSIVELIQEVIASFRGRFGVLLVEQFLEFALGIADQCYVMERGMITMQGSPDSLDQERVGRYLSV